MQAKAMQEAAALQGGGVDSTVQSPSGWDFPLWDPVFLDLPGPLDIRYYGLMYIVGFVAANWILVRLARHRFFPVAEERVGDLIFYCIFGVILGGRMGYALFYDQDLLAIPEIFQMYKGGLAFHGGLLGVIVAMVVFAARNKVSGLRVGDCLALAVTPGIFAVRMANFINGELYGRITSPDTFGAMQFPTDQQASKYLGFGSYDLDMRGKELALQVAKDADALRADPAVMAERLAELPEQDGQGLPIPWEQMVRDRILDWPALQARVLPGGDHVVPFRHPSQLYEGFGEGLFVGLLLMGIYLATRRRPLPPGSFAGLFLILYGAVRWGIELVRRPDQQFIKPDQDSMGAVFLGMTMGQTLCTGMIVAGAGMLVVAFRGRLTRGETHSAGETN